MLGTRQSRWDAGEALVLHCSLLYGNWPLKVALTCIFISEGLEGYLLSGGASNDAQRGTLAVDV